MQLIIINENVFKMIFSPDDMKKYGIDEDEFHLSSTNTRKIITEIIKNCPGGSELQNIGKDEKLIIQLYPEKSGGCELFVTRLPFEENIWEDEDMTQKDNSNLPILRQSSEATPKRRVLTYSFWELAWAKEALRSIESRNFSGKCEIFRSENGKYYLALFSEGSPEENSSPSLYLSEFGELENSEHMLLYLSEHGKRINKSDLEKCEESR